MPIERKEPTFSTPTSKAKNPSEQSAPKLKKPRTSPGPGKVIIQKQASGLLWLTFLLVLVVAGGAGYLFWQLQQTQQSMVAQQARIDELENKLLLTGDESTQSLTALTANLKDLDKNVKLAISEVDKLWATRNANVKKIDKARKELSAEIKDVNTTISSVESKLITPLNTLEQRTGEQELLIQSLRERLTEQGKTTSSLSNQIKQFSASTKQVNKISAKVDGYDETIRSFDKFRITTNRDLLLLKERAGVLSAPAK